MYKVYFDNRAAFLGRDFSGIQGISEDLHHMFSNEQKLCEIVKHFARSEQIRNLYLAHHDLPLLLKAFKSCFTFIEAGGGLVFNGNEEFLAIKRNGVWDLPKGKLEKGENFLKAALREVEEETGLKKLTILRAIISTYHTYHLSDQWILKETQWFEMKYPGSKKPVLQAKEGITDYQWVIPGKAGFIVENTYLSILDVLSTRALL